jgi:N-acetylglucosamine-6-phosphate deacetylase
VAPGFIDLHVWGDPRVVAREAVKSGTTAFLTTLGPQPSGALARAVCERAAIVRAGTDGAACLGLHLEGPFVNPRKAGALPTRGMRPPRTAELTRLVHASDGTLRLITMAPEVSGAAAAIQACRRRGIAVSLGHSEADARTALRAVRAGASAVTHTFNAMPPLHHREPSLLDVALLDSRLTAMVIADGRHVGWSVLKLLMRMKGPAGIALVTDSIRHQGWNVQARGGAYYTRAGRLAGSRLTMLEAVRHAVVHGRVSLLDAVRMAGETPARLIGMERFRGILDRGRRADVAVFDRRFRPVMTFINGTIAYQRGC